MMCYWQWYIITGSNRQAMYCKLQAAMHVINITEQTQGVTHK